MHVSRKSSHLDSSPLVHAETDAQHAGDEEGEDEEEAAGGSARQRQVGSYMKGNAESPHATGGLCAAMARRRSLASVTCQKRLVKDCRRRGRNLPRARPVELLLLIVQESRKSPNVVVLIKVTMLLPLVTSCTTIPSPFGEEEAKTFP